MTTRDQDARSTVASITYEDLYARWEAGNWSATTINLAADRRDWDALSEIQRKSMRWQFAMFFNGEDSVADNLSPYIDAAPREEQKYFLATQQADEARHAIFFGRVFTAVLDAGDGVAAGLESCTPDLNWGYRKTFERLDRVADELRRDRSLPKLAQAITLYHLIVEAQLAQPGQHFIENYTNRMDIMPGFRAGMENVTRDEQRHIAFGVKMLSELFAASDECKAAAAEVLREVLRYTVNVFVPPGMDRRYTEELGFSLEDIYAFGIESFDSKLRAAGLPVEELPPGVYPFDPAKSPAERAVEMVAMIDAGVTGNPDRPPTNSPDAQRALFDVVARSADTSATDGQPLILQWRFRDADPWLLRVDNGSTRAEPGESATPDVTIEARWSDWVATAIGTEGFLQSVLARRIGVRGNPRQLWRLRTLFPR
jgi:hypothetical protein